MKTRLLIIIVLVVALGFVGTAFAIHDPDQPQIHSIILSPDMKEKTFEEFMEWCMPFYEDLCAKLEKNRVLIILSPLKQFKSGIAIDEIQCKESLILVTKHDGSPACVKPETKIKLIERGWADNPVKLNTSIKQIKTISSDPVLAKKITESNNQFTLDFYKQVSKEKNENIFFSSPSISTAFSILYEGAKDDTAAEIQDVFGFPTDDNERQVGFISFINMMNQKNNDENTIQMSNALWLANGFTPLPEYINTAITY